MKLIEFQHTKISGNRTKPLATFENLIALLTAYNFIIAHNAEKIAVGLGEYSIHQKNIYGVPTHDSVFTYRVKLHLKSLCARHELPLSTVSYVKLIELDNFVVGAKKGKVNHD